MAKTFERAVKGTVGLLVQPSKEHGYFHVKAYPVTIGFTTRELAREASSRPSDVHDDTIRNYSSRYEWGEKGLRLDDLVAYSQGSDDRTPKELYGWSLHYSATRVELQDAEGMARTLTTIHKRFRKMDAEFGTPATYGQDPLRVAKAIGASRMVFCVKGQQYSSYREQTHQVTDLPDGARRTDNLIADWQEGKVHAA